MTRSEKFKSRNRKKNRQLPKQEQSTLDTLALVPQPIEDSDFRAFEAWQLDKYPLPANEPFEAVVPVLEDLAQQALRESNLRSHSSNEEMEEQDKRLSRASIPFAAASMSKSGEDLSSSEDEEESDDKATYECAEWEYDLKPRASAGKNQQKRKKADQEKRVRVPLSLLDENVPKSNPTKRKKTKGQQSIASDPLVLENDTLQSRCDSLESEKAVLGEELQATRSACTSLDESSMESMNDSFHISDLLNPANAPEELRLMFLEYAFGQETPLETTSSSLAKSSTESKVVKACSCLVGCNNCTQDLEERTLEETAKENTANAIHSDDARIVNRAAETENTASSTASYSNDTAPNTAVSILID